MSARGRILIIDDDSLMRQAMQQFYMDDYEVFVAASGEEGLRILREQAPIDAAIVDIKMAGVDGLETARRMKEIDPDLPIIFYTGYPGDYSEEQIDREHAPYDYVIKNERPARLARMVRNAVDSRRPGAHSEDLVRKARRDWQMVGGSPPMRKVYRTIKTIGPEDNKVMITGPTGTGKELVAKAIHRESRRAESPIGLLNCNHKPPDLIESELFGHHRGAFTGAVTDRIGLFEYADKGTVFLDEIGDLDITTQAKLLRVLETGEMKSIGSEEHKRVDVRVICATHRDLEAMVKAGEFREDLFYRLKGVRIEMPALRDRKEDIPDLIEYFAEQYCMKRGEGISVFDSSAVEVLVDRDWPGNVRQLMETVKSLIELTVSCYITADDVAAFFNIPSVAQSNGGLSEQVREFKRTLIIKALSRHENNVSAAARELSVDPSNLRRMMADLDVE